MKLLQILLIASCFALACARPEASYREQGSAHWKGSTLPDEAELTKWQTVYGPFDVPAGSTAAPGKVGHIFPVPQPPTGIVRRIVTDIVYRVQGDTEWQVWNGQHGKVYLHHSGLHYKGLSDMMLREQPVFVTFTDAASRPFEFPEGTGIFTQDNPPDPATWVACGHFENTAPQRFQFGMRITMWHRAIRDGDRHITMAWVGNASTETLDGTTEQEKYGYVYPLGPNNDQFPDYEILGMQWHNHVGTMSAELTERNSDLLIHKAQPPASLNAQNLDDEDRWHEVTFSPFVIFDEPLSLPNDAVFHVDTVVYHPDGYEVGMSFCSLFILYRDEHVPLQWFFMNPDRSPYRPAVEAWYYPRTGEIKYVRTG